jgi:hypothetical protein
MWSADLDFPTDGSTVLPELRTLLYAGGSERRAFRFGVAGRDSSVDSAASFYVGGNYVACLPQAQPVQARH